MRLLPLRLRGELDQLIVGQEFHLVAEVLVGPFTVANCLEDIGIRVPCQLPLFLGLNLLEILRLT